MKRKEIDEDEMMMMNLMMIDEKIKLKNNNQY